MIEFLHYYLVAIFIATGNLLSAQTTALLTSFESSETPSYSAGDLSGQNGWSLSGGSATVENTSTYIHDGTQGVKLSSTSAAVELNQVTYSGVTSGLTGVVYTDFWVKINPTTASSAFAIAVYDLWDSGNEKRAAQFEFSNLGVLSVYNAGSKVTIPASSYTSNAWIRLSTKIDYATSKYEAAVNGIVVQNGASNYSLDFRESYTPSGTYRPTGTKEYHSLRFWYSADTRDISIDSIYVGTNPIAGIPFSATSTERTITVTQPANATITLSPVVIDNIYEVGDTVIATISNVAAHYKFNGWTGALTSILTSDTFFVSSSVSLGADIIIDPLDPPTEYTVDLTQSAGGTISADPAVGPYYEGAVVKFTATPEIGYEFTSWSGITGTTAVENITVNSNLVVSALFTEGSYSTKLVNVSSVSEFNTAMTNMQPGDSIVLANGTYSGLGASLKNKGGTANYPVVITAANIGGAKITGSENFALVNCAYIKFKGLDFNTSVYHLFKLTECNNIRITQNVFKNDNGESGSKMIFIGGDGENAVCLSHHNRIDHNLFDGKSDAQPWVTLDGSGSEIDGGSPQMTQYDRIDHNHFRFNGPRADNEKETIRLGESALSESSAFCTIENNLFEECDGDPEIVSVKSCDNYVRNNTFIKCLGTVSLRHGDRTEVSGNYFFGQGKTEIVDGSTKGCGGVRVYGKDHKVFNNYFEGLTGSLWDAALTLTQGDASNGSSSALSSHFVAENLEFTHNTFVNCASDIEIGYTNNSKYGKPVVNCLIANNIIVQDANKVVTVLNSGNDVNFEDNIIYTTGAGTWGDLTFTASEATNVDPLLILTNGRVPGNSAAVPTETYKLSSNSPAIDPSVTAYAYVTKDAEGQLSVNARDLGADEYNASQAVTNGALDSTHVGPNAVIFAESNVSQYSITLSPVTNGSISVSPDQPLYNDGSTVTFTATPDEGYSFTSWSGISGDTATVTMTISSNLTVGATFTEDAESSINENAAVNQLSVYPNPFEGTTSIFVEGEAQVSVYTMSGQQIDAFEFNDSYKWTAPKSGLYFAIITSGSNVSTIKLIAK